MTRARVGLFLRSLDNDYQQRLREDALAMASKAGFEVDVQAAQNDSARQCEQISKALTGNGSAPLGAVLVSAVRDEVLAELARGAAQAGVGWVLLNREADYLEAVRGEFPDVPLFSVTPDQTEIGRVQGRQARALLPGGGEVLCVSGPAKTSSARLRLDGLRAELEAAENAAPGDYAIVTVEADWTSEGARMAVERWLEARGGKGQPPGLVVAQNDEMALGVRQALRDASVRLSVPAFAEIPISGCDGSPAFGQRLVREKRIAATVELPAAAGTALEWLQRAKGAGERPPLHVTLPVRSYPETTKLARR